MFTGRPILQPTVVDPMAFEFWKVSYFFVYIMQRVWGITWDQRLFCVRQSAVICIKQIGVTHIRTNLLPTVRNFDKHVALKVYLFYIKILSLLQNVLQFFHVIFSGMVMV